MAGLNLNYQQLLSDALSGTVDTIEIRSAFTPPQRFAVKDLVAHGGRVGTSGPGAVSQAKQTALQVTKPTIILTGAGIGTQTIAPGGVAGPNDWKVPVTVAAVGVVAVLFAAFSAGRAYERKRRR